MTNATQGAVDALAEQVEQWSRNQTWDVVDMAAFPLEANGGRRAILSVRTRDGTVHLDLISERPDGSALVEISAWPTLVRARLRRAGGNEQWQLVTPEGVPFHIDWTEPNYVRLVQDLLAA